MTELLLNDIVFLLSFDLRQWRLAKEPVRVLVTGAAGQIGYALLPMIARGIMLGAYQPVILHMLDIPAAAEALNGVKMELVDAAFPLLNGVVATTDVVEACTGVNVAVMVGGFPRKEGMERKDVMSKNVSIYKSQASALEQHAAPNCKEFTPSVPAKNITCLTRLDHNRALVSYVNHATVAGEPVRELVKDDEWLNGEFITTVQQRGAAIIKARKLSSALSVASAACDHIRDWVPGTPEGTWVSMGVYSDGSYNVPAGVIYSFPVTCKNGEWRMDNCPSLEIGRYHVQMRVFPPYLFSFYFFLGLSIDEFSRKKLDLTGAELTEEKELAYSCLSGMHSSLL
ncbi:malate dehydrogenase [Hibiscus syriacus]|uniref:Malate dehydrogenase n=1 Tax=Hibiscus syriacus TaxID=106335 RepID=A0A6A3B5L6_HIBSY|nr:malate dehydrogenase [Hibiscus syriacus]